MTMNWINEGLLCLLPLLKQVVHPLQGRVLWIPARERDLGRREGVEARIGGGAGLGVAYLGKYN